MNPYNSAIGRTELDPLGADISLTAPTPPDTGGGDGDIGTSHFGGLMDARWSDFFNISSGCTIDGMASSCGLAMQLLNSGSAELAPPTTVWAHGQWNFVHFDPNTGQYGITPGGEFFEPLNSNGNAPQNSGANPFPTFSKDNLKTVNDAIKLAQEMTKKKGCDEALKAYGIASLAALISGMTPNGNLFDGRTSTLTGPIGKNGATESMAAYFKENKTSVGAAVFPNSVTGRGSVTFLGDYFFNPASVDWVAFQRAIIMMHESVHQVG